MTNIPRVKIYQFHISSVTRSPHGTQRNQTYDPRSQHKARFPTFSLIRPRLVKRASHAIRTSTQKSHLVHVRAACPPYGRFLCSCCYTCSEPFHSQELRITFHCVIYISCHIYLEISCHHYAFNP